jgi:hypothetical protein
MMVKELVIGQDVFSCSYQHIAFAVNTQGFNDAGFAGVVSDQYWPELANTGPKQLGQVMSRKVGDKTFHALVCHSLDQNGWDETPKIVTQCLDSIDIPDDEIIAVVSIGGGPIGRAMGADPDAIRSGMEASQKTVVVYSK